VCGARARNDTIKQEINRRGIEMRAEVTCLNCGRGLGEIEGREGRMRLVRPGPNGVAPTLRNGRLTCGRCGGRAIVEPLTNAA
jgi:hypothetical protein